MSKTSEIKQISRVAWIVITAFVGSLIASNAVLIADNSETKTRLDDVLKNVDKNTKSIDAIKEQTQILLAIKAGLDYVIKENKQSNQYLGRLSAIQNATALEQAKRKTIVYKSAEHMDNTEIHR